MLLEVSKQKILIQKSFLLKVINDKYESFEIEALDKNLICLSIKNQLVCDIQYKLDHLKDWKLCDSGHEGDVELLIGSDCYYELVKGEGKSRSHRGSR